MDRIKILTSKSKVVIFMKGSPSKPYDDFQKGMLRILDELKVNYTTHNVLPDSELKCILKDYAKYQSYPMLFVEGKFVSGFTEL